MRKYLIAIAAFVAVFALATPAFAHVTVSAPGATSGGGDVQITFRVPVEEDQPTVGVTIDLPTATPIASVEVAPLAGWTHTETTTKLTKPIVTDDGNITEAVTKIVWTARDGGLLPGEFGDFTIIAGQLPKADSVVFTALQKYQDGSVVSWNQQAAPGTHEPEHPAPTLELSGASTDSARDVAVTASDTTATRSSTVPTVLAIVALVLAAAALAVAVVGARRKRSS